MAVEAVKQVATQTNRALSGFFIKEGHFLAPIRIGDTVQDAVETEIHLRPLEKVFEKDHSTFEIRIFTYHDDAWTECFRGDIQVQFESTSGPMQGQLGSSQGAERRLEHIRARRHIEQCVASCSKAVSSKAFYEYCRESGLHFGDAFQLLRNIAWDGRNTSVGNIHLTQPSDVQRRQIGLSPVHPAVLDAVVHLIFAQFTKGVNPTSQPPTLVPQRIDNGWISARVWDEVSSSVRVCSTMGEHRDGATTINGEFHAMADNGEVLCILENMTLAQVSRDDTEDQVGSACFLYNISWKAQLGSLIGTRGLQIYCDESRLPIDGEVLGRIHSNIDLAMCTIAYRAVGKVPKSTLDNCPIHIRQYASAIESLYCRQRQVQNHSLVESHDHSLRDIDNWCRLIPELRLFSLVAEALPSILRGQTNPLELLFDSEAAKVFYGHVFNEPVRDGRLKAFMDLKSHEEPNMKILEVGAGTGGFTQHILNILHSLEKETGASRFAEYVYTDISPAYFEAARELFDHSPEKMVFDTLDVEQDPESRETRDRFQTSLGKYDLVIAASVIHATSTLQKTLQNVRKFLKPGGQLILLEITVPDSACINIAFGPLEGWWLSSEDWRQNGPMVDESCWGKILERSGFSGLDLVIRDRYGDGHLASIMISTAVSDRATVNGVCPSPIKILADATSSSQAAMASEILSQYPGSQVLYLKQLFGNSCDLISPSDLVISLLDLDSPTLANLSEAQFLGVKAMIRDTKRIMWVSSGSADGAAISNPHCGTSMGFLRAIRHEEPTKHIVALAIESCSPHNESMFVFEILRSCFFETREGYLPSKEVEFIVHDDRLKIGRMVKESDLDVKRLSHTTPKLRREPYNPHTPILLEAGIPGMLDSLRFVRDSVASEELGPHEIEIMARAWAVSFRDVFVALGRMGNEPMGFDCAGIVTRIGSSVLSSSAHDTCSIQPGDRVVMVQAGCMRSHPRASAIDVMKIPDELSFEDAVSALNPGITAYYSLKEVARLDCGERVLIHAAAGSTGQMAVHIAKMLGAEIFATVGSDDKKELLVREFGLAADHIFYSRDTSFAQGVRRMTNGKGVDVSLSPPQNAALSSLALLSHVIAFHFLLTSNRQVILNSLSGKMLEASWQCLAAYGRFVEIGKVDITANSPLPMRGFAQNRGFTAVDLYHISINNKRLSRKLLETVMDLTVQGHIARPSPLHVYSVANVEQAFRFLQSGRNTGRIIVTLNNKDVVPVRCDITRPTVPATGTRL